MQLFSHFDAEKHNSQDFIEVNTEWSICSIVISECEVVVKDLVWTSDQNKNSRSRKVIQFCSWQLFHLKSFIEQKLCMNSHI